MNSASTGFYFSVGTIKLGPPKEDCENCEGYGTKPISFMELEDE